MSLLPHMRILLVAGALLGALLMYSDQARKWIYTPMGSRTKVASVRNYSVPGADDVLVDYDDDQSVLAPSQASSGTGKTPASTPDEGDETKEVNLTFSPGFVPHPNTYSDTYIPRGRPISDEERKQFADKWGSWTFVDASDRPMTDYYAKYPSRDVPRSQFPSNAWQTDTQYLSKFLPEAQSLINRAMEGILAEYGYGLDDKPDQPFEERSDMFRVEVSDEPMLALFDKVNGTLDAGGYMNVKGYGGLIRRILHAIMTEDTFRVVTGGHSATAGHGNHFQQSYTLQIQRVLEPIFARLGVTMTAHNIAVGGMGTISNAMCAKDIYGDDVDVLIYDSGMTEPEPSHQDLFLRQAILSGEKIPFLWASNDNGRFFKSEHFNYLGIECGADLGLFGSGMRGIPDTTPDTDLSTVAAASQYLKCDNDMKAQCREVEYRSQCWIERDDVTPPVEQHPEPGGRARWHPGYRAHQLQGRVFTFIILTAMSKGIQTWLAADNHVLKDSDWHVDRYYADIRTKLISLDRPTHCHKQETEFKFPTRACDVPMRGRTEFAPRVDAHATSILSIVKGGELLDQVKPNAYDPPDVYNPNLDFDTVHLINVVENGVPFSRALLGHKRRKMERLQFNAQHQQISASPPMNPEIKPGVGWYLDAPSAPGNCDGSFDSFCARSEENECLLYGHNDHRGGLIFDGMSGWLVLNLNHVQHGLITLKIEDWHWDQNPLTEFWWCENNECPRRALRGEELSPSSSDGPRQRRRTKQTVPEYCPDFAFEFAIDGKITKWELEEWKSREQKGARVAQFWTLLDDANFTDEPRDVELAIRITGCQRIKTFKLTHVYWA